MIEIDFLSTYLDCEIPYVIWSNCKLTIQSTENLTVHGPKGSSLHTHETDSCVSVTKEVWSVSSDSVTDSNEYVSVKL